MSDEPRGADVPIIAFGKDADDPPPKQDPPPRITGRDDTSTPKGD